MMVGLILMNVSLCKKSVKPPKMRTMIAVTTGMIGSRRVSTYDAASAASTATINVAVAVKIPKRELAKKNRTSGPKSRAIFTIGFSGGFTLSVMPISSAAAPRIQSRSCSGDGAGEVTRRKWRQIVDSLADTDKMHRHAELAGDGDE